MTFPSKVFYVNGIEVRVQKCYSRLDRTLVIGGREIGTFPIKKLYRVLNQLGISEADITLKEEIE